MNNYWFKNTISKKKKKNKDFLHLKVTTKKALIYSRDFQTTSQTSDLSAAHRASPL